MAPIIRVDEEVYAALEARAQGFGDTPNDVLRRVLHIDGPTKASESGATTAAGTRGVRPPSKGATPESKREEANGEITPQSEYQEPILVVLKTLPNGEGRAGEVLDHVFEVMEDRLTSRDLEFQPSGADVRWHNAAMWQRLKMVHAGLLEPIPPRGTCPRGIWRLTDAGWAAARRTLGEDE
jgi:hypothetical protein